MSQPAIKLEAVPTPFEGLKPGYNKVSNHEYHKDTTHLSSTVLKTLYKDPSDYYRQYILGDRDVIKNQEALNIGSLTHTMLLEPEMRDVDYAFSPAWRRNELKHKEFIASLGPNDKRTVITAPENEKVNKLIEAYKRLPDAVNLMAEGESEYTLCTTLNDVPVKARFDRVNIEKGFILDVKTTGYSSDLYSFKSASERLMYELSAALYLAVVEKVFNRPFDFYFLVLSKSDFTCDIFKTSYDTRIKGMAKVNKALANYKYGKATGLWEKPTSNTKELVFGDYEILEI